ncbi:hypothetical protein MXEN_19129 [Mycobacterium xenopi RIVM700367]|nr:hypothetical protein MXEN_19129 [Mycobacterium xenopi RIVM700367]
MNASPAPTVSTTSTGRAAACARPAAHTANAPRAPVVTATIDGPSANQVRAGMHHNRWRCRRDTGKLPVEVEHVVGQPAVG